MLSKRMKSVNFARQSQTTPAGPVPTKRLVVKSGTSPVPRVEAPAQEQKLQEPSATQPASPVVLAESKAAEAQTVMPPATVRRLEVQDLPVELASSVSKAKQSKPQSGSQGIMPEILEKKGSGAGVSDMQGVSPIKSPAPAKKPPAPPTSATHQQPTSIPNGAGAADEKNQFTVAKQAETVGNTEQPETGGAARSFNALKSSAPAKPAPVPPGRRTPEKPNEEKALEKLAKERSRSNTQPVPVSEVMEKKKITPMSRMNSAPDLGTGNTSPRDTDTMCSHSQVSKFCMICHLQARKSSSPERNFVFRSPSHPVAMALKGLAPKRPPPKPP
eukprot:gb/GEZN01013748.1/.p1 GENE.gb/GEZN01013748.1/~~gb/GEZN01013748.1/.p1  ORF type:complete len:330 (+),score=37.88 gb/GEZN01013748.1/:3-992(+)